jgi:hypothetical protein
MINLSIELAGGPALGEEKRAQDVEYNLSVELEIFCLNRP